MAVLTSDQLATMRRQCALGETVTWTKSQIDTALQAVEDWYENNKTSLSTAITAATTLKGITFTAAQQQKIGAFWFLQKASREGA